MSRHIIPALHDEFTVVVGRDNPRHTYFAQVERVTTREENDEDRIVLWLGGTPDEPFAALADDMPRQLHDDCAQSASRWPTQLQSFHLDLLRGRR